MNRLVNYLAIILKWRKLIVLNTVIITVIVLAVSFILPKRYTATAQLLPPTDEGDIFGLTSVLGTGLGGLSKLRISGLGGAATASDIMAGILSSRTIVAKVADECSIAYYYRIKPTKTELVQRQLRKMTKVGVGSEGIVRISVEAKTPHLAAKIANAYISELDNFLRTSNISRGHNMRVFLERRLGEMEKTLAIAQESLKVFQARHKVVAVDEETKAAIDAYARLKSQAYVKQAELEAIKDISSPDNPYYINLQREVQAFSDQLRQLEHGGAKGFGVGFGVSFEHLPEVGAEFARRYRDYRILEEAYAMLYQQYEYAKVLEARDAPTLTVLDYAVPPQRHSFPKRSIFTIGGFVFSLALGVGFAFISEYFEYLRRVKAEEYASWVTLWAEVRRAFRGHL
ncbi:MAG: Wzz/FepE/Etk N-terminal domain-containing protein [candidate division WOR-3 bacterium]